MDPKVAQLLTEWGLPQPVIETFKENEILSIRHLLALRIEDVADLLTRGQKALFRESLESWQAKSKQGQEQASTSAAVDLENETVELVLPVHNASDITEQFTILSSPVSKKTPPRQSKRQGSKSPGAVKVSRTLVFEPITTGPSAPAVEPSTSSSTPSDNPPSSSNPSIDKSDAPTSSLAKHLTTANCVRNLLKSTNPGLIILGEFEAQNQLSAASQNSLCHILVNHEMDLSPLKEVKSSQFLLLRKLIVKVFPSEKGHQYFTPAVTHGKKTTKATGKLVNFYHNSRRQLRNAKVIESTRKKRSSEALGKDVLFSLRSLQESAEHYDTTFNHWVITHAARLRELEKEDGDQNVNWYFAKYKGLRNNNGIHLLLEDFKIRYPDKENSLFHEWPLFRLKLFAYIKDRIEKDPAFADILDSVGLKEDCVDQDENAINLRALYFLLLCLPQKAIRGTKKSWKPANKTELLQYFIPVVPSFGELQNFIIAKKEAFEKFGITVQPFVAFVKDNAQQKNLFYVCVDNVMYKQETLLTAFDAVFKVCNSLVVNYAFEAKFLFVFLQSFIYKLETKYDFHYNVVEKFTEAFLKFKFETPENPESPNISDDSDEAM